MSLERAYYDWITNDAYLSSNGYRLKSNGKRIAPWNMEIKAKYGNSQFGDGNTNFHNDAVKWAEGKGYQKQEFVRLREINEDRSNIAKTADNNRSNKITVEPYDQKVKRWRRNQGTMDIKGIDTPSRNFPQISPKIPRLK